MSRVYSGVLAELGPRIVSGGLPAETMITLDWLQREYAVSRTVAREVVQVLASMGLVESRRRTGIRVRPAADWDVFDPAVVRWQLDGARRDDVLRELTQLRQGVEPVAVGLAAIRAGDGERAEVVRLAEELELTGAAGDLRAFLELDVAFHRLLLGASRNDRFAALGDTVEAVLRGRTDLDLMPPEPKPEARALHAEVARAVAAGERSAAEEAMRAICAEVFEQVGDA